MADTTPTAHEAGYTFSPIISIEGTGVGAAERLVRAMAGIPRDDPARAVRPPEERRHGHGRLVATVIAADASAWVMRMDENWYPSVGLAAEPEIAFGPEIEAIFKRMERKYIAVQIMVSLLSVGLSFALVCALLWWRS